ncbi:hypothetical protein [Paraburkholderia bonniea]|uniref:hypothetical protein n=1 Tax=Paraburkholderia bonniea TaxID=2152891 RepID=UPI001291693E|nr:hypothetical protein [Paraburkholderia bonniea]
MKNKQDKKMYSIFMPVIPIGIGRFLFFLMFFGLMLVAILTPAVNQNNFGLVGDLCSVGHRIPMVRSLIFGNRYPCTLSASYGLAVFLGFYMSLIVCFTKMKDSIKYQDILYASRGKKLALTFVIVLFLGGTWLFGSPPPTKGIMGIFTSNRVMIAIGAPLFYGAHVMVWTTLFLMIKLQLRGEEWKR